MNMNAAQSSSMSGGTANNYQNQFYIDQQKQRNDMTSKKLAGMSMTQHGNGSGINNGSRTPSRQVNVYNILFKISFPQRLEF